MLSAQPLSAPVLMAAPPQAAAIDTDAGPLRIRHLGLTVHAETFAAMQAFTAARDPQTPDEIWITEHHPVYTQGLAGKAEHVLSPGVIPVAAIDRGGQVTYHGPGQVVAYVLLDLRRRELKVRELVVRLEDALIATLAEYGVPGQRRAGMPGVYVNDAKIAALGLKIKNGCSYHGVSLNVAMDLAPFAGINPCGYAGLAAAQLSQFVPGAEPAQVAQRLAAQLKTTLDLR